MYDRKQIIEEIKRVAGSLKTNSLKKKDFIKNTMIPVSTINFYISSWEEALKEAGLDADFAVQPNFKDNDLLKDLIRIDEEFGESPTYALIENHGKYSKEDYQKKWRNLDEAYKIAKSRYGKKKPVSPDKTVVKSKDTGDIISPDKTIAASKEKADSNDSGINLEETLISMKKENIDLSIRKKDHSKEVSDDFGDNNILTIEDMKKKAKDGSARDENGPSFDYLPDDDGGIENLMAMDVRKPGKKKIVPETIKPRTKKVEKQRRESLDFRGLKFAPVDTRGVLYIFGLVSEELNFVVESFGTDRFCFSAKRNLLAEGEKWENVKIGFALDSLDLKSGGKLTKSCELLVCWKHGWKECPVEVLELRSTLKLLKDL